MKTSDWNNPRLREIGAKFAADAHEMASELHSYGADASTLLSPRRAWQPRSYPREICVPKPFADALMAILLSQPRPDIGRPRNWSPDRVQASMNRGMSLAAAARKETERTGKPAKDIERAYRLWRAKKNKKPSKKKTPL
jgi:hypothetical protein